MEKYIKIKGKYEFISHVRGLPKSSKTHIVTLKKAIVRVTPYGETRHSYFTVESLYTNDIEEIKILEYIK